ncbi:acyl CoA:acetate/3-ketoacid CoA transferase [Hydrogenophaga sp. IBVHS1]|uniref:acyl CoA:acetate/3-ketoacid CoA transferase n=1 Tax=unclassified Hydrogenophaga TaxID=2610897 RepID=UPI000A2D9923|nr:CoA-transferase [Hydrogenophaga sp. IBVHS1]OSZ75798.1 acyl CoA:acetate/3-ketoacid CoA transferase [Hydrogenophaga sp. IBVHS1]
MSDSKFMTAAQAVALIRDGDTVGLMGGGGGLMEATHVFEAVQARFLATQHPRGLTVMHALGIGDKKTKGMNCFAHEGLVRRVIGGHWVWSPAMQQLAVDEKIEAYILPGGVSSQLMREIGAGRPGLFTHVGLGTVCDPRLGGGRMNATAKDDLAEVVHMDGREYLRYKPFPIHVAIVRASAADEDGNISFEHEAANLDAQSLALAARNSGGKVIVQVAERLPRGALKAREVRIPSAWVDAVVVDPDQRTSYDIPFDPSFSGELTGAARERSEAADHAREVAAAQEAFGERQAIARRAAVELFNTGKARPVVNYGVGVPDAVARLIAARGDQHRLYQTIEHGTYGGTLMDGVLFGYARNASAMLDAATQFDFYAGGGLDIAFLGFGEFDVEGSVNVSKLGGLTVGPGGFIDIAQNARKVVFCGTLAAKGVKLQTGDGQMRVLQQGAVKKLVERVDQITFSGPQSLVRGQEVIYLTERASFRLTPQGIELFEIAPGIDLQRDVLDQMAFAPLLAADMGVMSGEHFCATEAAPILPK